MVKQLRERTGAGMMECKSALVEAKGDSAEAEVVLRKRGIASASKKSARSTKQGVIASYIHPGAQLGVLIEVNCESDFVARTDDFQALVHDLAMQIAAADPEFIRKEDVTQAALDRERDIQRARALGEGTPEKMVDKIVEGRLHKFYEGIGLYKGKHDHRRRSDQDQDRQARREYCGVALRTVQGGRSGRGGDAGGRESINTVPRYGRILLKLSGEVMAGEGSFGIDATRVAALAAEVAEVARSGVQIGLVVGGGNFFRGVAAAAQNMDRVAADHMGMLATVINALALQDALEKQGVPTRVMTAIEMHEVAEPYIRRRAILHLEKGRIVVFAAGTSNPYFSTDTAATLRGLEIHAEVVAKATRVDGVYDMDPLRNPGAVRFNEIGYSDVLSRNLRVMDASAVAMCRDNQLPIVVFNLNVRGNIMRMATGEPIGTLIH
jgi:uridylate kinase